MVLAVALLAVHGEARTQDRAELQRQMDNLAALLRMYREGVTKLESGQLMLGAGYSLRYPGEFAEALMTPAAFDQMMQRLVDNGDLKPELVDRVRLAYATQSKQLSRVLREEIDDMQKEYDQAQSAWTDMATRPRPSNASRIFYSQNLNNLGIAGRKGDQFAYACVGEPDEGDEYFNSVIGTTIYADDSSICLAAIHAGLIPKRPKDYKSSVVNPPIVVIQVMPPEPWYRGTAQNGITSRDVPSGHSRTASFRFIK